MSEDSKPKHFCHFQITEKGMALRQRTVAAGKESPEDETAAVVIDFTRGAIGVGRPDPDTDIYFMEDLAGHVADVPIKESYAKGRNHVMTIVIDGENFQDDILMTEIGIFARLLDAKTGEELIPELLYGYTFTYRYDYIPAGDEYNLHREISFDTVLSNDGKFEILYDKTKVYITHQEFEEYRRLSEAAFGAKYPVDGIITHDLNTYPDAVVLENGCGFGVGGFGQGPYGGTDGRKLRNSIEYVDRNRIRLSAEKPFNPVQNVVRTSRNEFIITFTDSTVSLSVMLAENASSDRKLADLQESIEDVRALYNRELTRQYAAIQNLSDEIITLRNRTESYVIDGIITHNLNAYPDAAVIESSRGYGLGGFGQGPYGGMNGRKLRSSVEYLNRNQIRLSVEKQYGAVRDITRVSENGYVITFVDSTLSLLVLLYTDIVDGTGGSQDPSGIQTNGVHVGDAPPEDTGLLWLKPVLSRFSTIETI